MLYEYLSQKIRVQDNSVFNEIIEPLKEVRKLRQNPAHKIEEDEYNSEYYEKQKKGFFLCKKVMSQKPMQTQKTLRKILIILEPVAASLMRCVRVAIACWACVRLTLTRFPSRWVQ